VPNAASATEIAPEGFLYTGFGKLIFLLGPEQTPLAARVRTLQDARLPIPSYTHQHIGIAYSFRVFAARATSLGTNSKSASDGTIVNFVRVTLHNPGSALRAAFFTTALRYQATPTTARAIGDNRFVRPAVADRVGDYEQPGEPFRSNWRYSLEPLPGSPSWVPACAMGTPCLSTRSSRCPSFHSRCIRSTTMWSRCSPPPLTRSQ
jgi:hypothetical protein